MRAIFRSKMTAELLTKWQSSFEPLTRKEVHLAKREISAFLDTLPIKTVNRPKIKTIKFYGLAQGFADPISCNITLEKEIFTGVNFKKCITSDGKTSFVDACGKDSHTKIPKIGDTLFLEPELPFECIKPLSKAERLEYAKFLAAHEKYHQWQFGNMILHPEIGPKKFIKMFKPAKDNDMAKDVIKYYLSVEKNIFKKIPILLNESFTYQKFVHFIRTLIYKPKHIKFKKVQKLNTESNIAKTAKEEYISHGNLSKAVREDANAFQEQYAEDLLELHAYQFGDKLNTAKKLII